MFLQNFFSIKGGFFELFNTCLFKKNFEGFFAGFFSLSRVLFSFPCFSFFNVFLKKKWLFSQRSPKGFPFLLSFSSDRLSKVFPMFFKGFVFFEREEREGREWKKELFLPFSNVFLQSFSSFFCFF